MPPLRYEKAEYGPAAVQPRPSESDIAAEEKRILARLHVTRELQNEIAINTIGQFGNYLYEAEKAEYGPAAVQPRPSESDIAAEEKRILARLHKLVALIFTLELAIEDEDVQIFNRLIRKVCEVKGIMKSSRITPTTSQSTCGLVNTLTTPIVHAEPSTSGPSTSNIVGGSLNTSKCFKHFILISEGVKEVEAVQSPPAAASSVRMGRNEEVVPVQVLCDVPVEQISPTPPPASPVSSSAAASDYDEEEDVVFKGLRMIEGHYEERLETMLKHLRSDSPETEFNENEIEEDCEDQTTLSDEISAQNEGNNDYDVDDSL
ncbi:hypothetical protein FQR65_LT15931 [Abscondita terminalis]|nr:hypothetical protein FQR65_LT15931 [Abscondita terminalis]